MRKLIVFLGLLLAVTFFAGCSNNNAPKGDIANQPANVAAGQEKTAAATDQGKTAVVTDQEKTTAAAGQGKNTVPKDTEDFTKYKGTWKLKVAENEELYLMTSLEEIFGSTGINIAEINNGVAKGSIYSIQGAPSYRQAEVAFTGKIEGGKLKAAYKDEGWLYTGNLELTFDKDMIIADIKRDKVEPAPMWGIPAGNFTFKRPIDTEDVKMPAKDKEDLEKFLVPTSEDGIKPFAEGALKDETMINFVGLNLALGFIDASEFGDKVKNGADIVFDESVMNALTKKYFGVQVKQHKTFDNIVYKDGQYTVPALGGVSEYPQVQLLMKDTGNQDIYYAIVDYVFEYPDKGKQLEYQRLLKLHKDDGYTIKSIKDIKPPIDFKLLAGIIN